LLAEQGIKPKKYSWKFNRDEECLKIFSFKSEFELEYSEQYINKMSDFFLPRMQGRGFSDQADVPEEIHNKVFSEVLENFKYRYSDDFHSAVYQGEEGNILFKIYTK
jgi:hypothetical protein